MKDLIKRLQKDIFKVGFIIGYGIGIRIKKQYSYDLIKKNLFNLRLSTKIPFQRM